MTMIEEEDEANHSKPIMKMRKELFTNPRKKQKEKDEKANLADIMKKSELVLLTTLFEELKTILLEGLNGDVSASDLWYLDMSVNNHMTGKKDLFYHFDDFHIRKDVVFEEGSKWE
ncbi:unnamed protein product [Spirodela intermedia]|uniref:Uncharacterized protein n=1 Tax=Spirodela intermedia TaxID=51605 RepID=A0A7I8JYE0_SPIIN|nr:unnamed protein product [Spirodela intermedia]